MYIDLPKYYPYLSEKACNDWKSFKLANPEKLSEQNIPWELPSLLTAAIVSSECHNDPKDSVSADTLRLLEKEVATPKPVST